MAPQNAGILPISLHGVVRSQYESSLSTWGRVLVKLTITQLIKKSPTFYRTQKFITCSQEPTTGPYPELDASSPHLPTLLP